MTIATASRIDSTFGGLITGNRSNYVLLELKRKKYKASRVYTLGRLRYSNLPLLERISNVKAMYLLNGFVE